MRHFLFLPRANPSILRRHQSSFEIKEEEEEEQQQRIHKYVKVMDHVR